MGNRALGLDFTCRTRNELAELFTRDAPDYGVCLVCTANVDHIVNITINADFRAAYQFARFITADGAPVHLYARLRGIPVPERITGTDLLSAIMHRLDAARHRPVFLPGQEATATAIAERLAGMGFAPDKFIVEVPPIGFEDDASWSEAFVARISRLGATHVFFGVGSPKSEIWVHRHRQLLGDLYAFGFGTGLDYYAGTARRAPIFVQKAGFEWLWRLAMEPRRLARRYLVNSWRVPIIVARDLFCPADPPHFSRSGERDRG